VENLSVTGLIRWAIALIAFAAGVVVMVLAFRSPAGMESATKIVALIGGLAPLVVGLITWARRAPSAALAASTSEQVAAAQHQLAGQVRNQWHRETMVRQLDDPGPLAVRWRLTELDVVDRPEHVAGPDVGRSLIGRGPLQFSGRTDRIGEMASGFRGLARRRLVILGEPGTGKTTTAVLLVRELLDRYEPGEPVPVLLTMSDWDPSTETLYEWLAHRLAVDYPALRAAAFGPDAPRSLVAQRRIMPVLDGLDELPEQRRVKILVRLNEVAADPLVLTCRTAEYEAAVTAPGGDALTGAAVIEPIPLTAADAADYLAGCLPPRAGPGWPDLLAVLNSDPNSPIARALATPLALWLLRKTYVDHRADPSGLCDTSRFDTADAIVDHLLDDVVGAVIRANPPTTKPDEHPFRPRRAWPPARATAWLGFLARDMNTLGSGDLAWWQLRYVALRKGAAAAGVVAGLVMAVAVGLRDGISFGLTTGLVDATVLGLVFGITVGFATGLTVWLVFALLLGLTVSDAGLSAVVAGQPGVGLAFGVVGAIPTAIAIVLAVKGIGARPAHLPAYADLRLRGRVRLLARKLTHVGGGRRALRLMPGFAIGFAFALVVGAALGTSNVVMSALVDGLVVGVIAACAIGLTDWAETPLTDQQRQTPATTFRRDLRLVWVKSVTGGLALGLILWITTPSSAGDGLAIGILFALAIALGVGLHQPSGRYLATVLVFSAQRRTPLRLLSFLDDAHRLGILREVGSVYQFRHARLQDHFARTGQGG
jgi:hypothetical protein